MDTSNRHIVTVQQCTDSDDMFIEIPEEITTELNWKDGDTIDWTLDNDCITITKVND
tara:strand:- start:578 stop:748 length:171 start_codon:yes stop_codon:yes gene_type:complete